MSSKDNSAGAPRLANGGAGRFKILAVCCVLILSFSAGSAAGERTRDRYVSPGGRDWSNNGSKRRPWRTIEYAGSMAAPGTTIHVLPGTYRLSKIIMTRASGTAAARIR